jgi:tRNA(Ile)-lysidine synthase
VLGYIRKHELIRAGDRVAIAVSGGADSVALLRLMLELRNELGTVLSIVHLNHQLRGAESDADEQFVRALADLHDLEIACEGRDVKANAAGNKLSLEAAARKLRYEFFRCVLQSGVNRIATAHTLDDQAETVLLKLTRGAGTRGLAGVYPRILVRRPSSSVAEEAVSSQLSALSESAKPAIEGSIIRPLLGTRRSQLREYLAEIGQSWREDATNQDLRHTRNRIRHEVLPRIEQELNPSICEVLAETADIAREEEEYWEYEVGRLLPQLWHKNEDGGSLDRRALGKQPLALRRRLVRAAAESVGHTLEFRHVEEILELAREGSRTVVEESVVVIRQGNELHFCGSAERASDYSYDLSVPGIIDIPEAGVRIEALIVTSENDEKYDPRHLIDPGQTTASFSVRNWRAGDRFWPAHTRQPKKIKELLQDRHITGERKRRWPVVASGEEVVWLRGFGVRRDFQAQGNKGILIREAKLNLPESTHEGRN